MKGPLFVGAAALIGGGVGLLIGQQAAQTIGVLLTIALIVLLALFPHEI